MKKMLLVKWKISKPQQLNEQMDTDTVVKQKVNKGFLERSDFFDDEWETEIIIPLHLDFFLNWKIPKKQL